MSSATKHKAQIWQYKHHCQYVSISGDDGGITRQNCDPQQEWHLTMMTCCIAAAWILSLKARSGVRCTCLPTLPVASRVTSARAYAKPAVLFREKGLAAQLLHVNATHACTDRQRAMKLHTSGHTSARGNQDINTLLYHRDARRSLSDNCWALQSCQYVA